MEFEPIDHLICSMASQRETTIKEIMKTSHENIDTITNLLKYGISEHILSKNVKNGETFYTLTADGEKFLSMMNSKIIKGWKSINHAIETKDIDAFVRQVKEHEQWIQYLRYTKIVSIEDADFIIDSYKKIVKFRQKKSVKDPEISRMQTDAEIERTSVLTKQQWEFDDQNYEITRDHNNYVDSNYDNNY